MTISKRLRFEVMRRDNHTCRYCGATADDGPLTLDHVIPTALGGGDDPSNLVTACRDCNAGKSSSTPDAPLVDDVAQDAVRWRRAIEMAGDEAQAEHDQWNSIVGAFYEDWERGWLPDDWQDSVRRWLDLGLTAGDLARLQNKTFSRGREGYWRYFCGAAWGMLRDRQARAKQLLEDGETRWD